MLNVTNFRGMAPRFAALDKNKFTPNQPQIETRFVSANPLRIEIETSKRSRPANLQLTAAMAKQVKGFRQGQYLPIPFQLELDVNRIYWVANPGTAQETRVPMLEGSEHPAYNWRYFGYFLEDAIRVSTTHNSSEPTVTQVLRNFFEVVQQNVRAFKD